MKARWIFTVLAILAVLAAGTLSTFWIEHRTAITLPAPSGSFAVGRAIYDWVDDAHVDGFAPAAGTKRELLVWIWYPAAMEARAVLDDYVPTAMRVRPSPAGEPLIVRTLNWMFQVLEKDPSKVRGHSLRNAGVSPRQQTYPVVIMRGGASAEVMRYSTLAEDLASRGYVVVGLDAPYRTFEVAFPDGRVIGRRPENNVEEFDGPEATVLADTLVQGWSADMSFTIDRLEQMDASDPEGRFRGRLDLEHVGAFGHSLGGAEALQFCHDDPRCKASIDVDGIPWGTVVQEGLMQPAMFLMSDHKLDTLVESDAESRAVEASFRSLYQRLHEERTLKLTIRGANHYMFSDDAVLRSQIVLGTLRRVRILGIDGPRQLAVTAYAVRSFFDAYLKSSGVARPRILSPLYPELKAVGVNDIY